MDQNNIILIKKWLELEKDIGNYSSKLRELRKEKRELNCKMVEIMKSHRFSCRFFYFGRFLCQFVFILIYFHILSC